LALRLLSHSLENGFNASSVLFGFLEMLQKLHAILPRKMPSPFSVKL